MSSDSSLRTRGLSVSLGDESCRKCDQTVACTLVGCVGLGGVWLGGVGQGGVRLGCVGPGKVTLRGQERGVCASCGVKPPQFAMVTSSSSWNSPTSPPLSVCVLRRGRWCLSKAVAVDIGELYARSVSE